MKDLQPRVSVIIPTFNAETTLDAAIASVLHQSFTNWELLIVDDASTDETAAIARRYGYTDPRVRVILGAINQGVAAVRNYGVAHCRGEFIAFLDSDDTWEPDKLKKQLDKIQETEADLCYTSYAIVNMNGEKVRADYLVPNETDYASMLRENVIGCSTVLLSAQLAKKYPFEAAFYHEDYVLWLKLLKDGHHAVGCREVLTNWRYREDSRSFNKLKSLQKRWEVYRNALQLPLIESIGYLCDYIAAGMRKYRPLQDSLQTSREDRQQYERQSKDTPSSR